MTSWTDYFKRKAMNTSAPMTISAPTSGIPISSAIPTPWYAPNGLFSSGAASPTKVQTYNTAGAMGQGHATTGNIATIGGTSGAIGGATGGAMVGTTNANTFIFNPMPNNLVTVWSSSNKEIVRLNADGSVTWNSEIDVDAAAEAFGRALTMGAELSAGITKRVKLKMRDSIFEDIISIAKEKGSLTADDLTYLLEASKIVEKLKGGRE